MLDGREVYNFTSDSLFPRGVPMGLSLIGHAAAEVAPLFCEAGGELLRFARLSSGTTLSCRAHCRVTASVRLHEVSCVAYSTGVDWWYQLSSLTIHRFAVPRVTC